MNVQHTPSPASTSQPAPATPRQRRRAANLARILDAALDLVVTGGFDGLSMHKLADAVDYTPGALYRYFPSKDALIAALTTRLIDDFAAVLARVPPLVEGPLPRTLALLLAYRDLARHAPNRFGLISLLLADPRLLVPSDADAASPRAAMTRALAPLVGQLLAAEEAGVLDGAPSGPADTAAPTPQARAAERAAVLFASMHGLLQLRKQEARVPVVADLDRLVLVSLRAQLLGFGADPDTLDPALRAVTALGDLVARAGGLDRSTP